MSTRDRGGRPRRPLSGQDLIGELERSLGVGVMIQAIDEQPEFTIRALLMYGQLSEEVVATAATEGDAWRRLAEIAIAWRSGNDKHIPLWWGGGVA